MKRILTLFLLPIALTTTRAQTVPPDPADSAVPPGSMTQRVFRLGEVTVTSLSEQDSTRAVSSQRMEAFNRLDVSRALNLLPGVTVSNVGARNESMVFVRGFDLRQTPVFIDGVPVYVPYDGYVDLARFTTFDLSEINVAKGFSSVTYGPNTMGGAINLISRRPVKKLEGEARMGWMSGAGYRLNLNVGTNLGKFYLQGGISQLKRETYPLSRDYQPKTLEDGGNRENAYRRDTKYSIKVGFTPNATDEYALSYVNQQGEKGTPSYVGNDPRQSARFWQWPYWNKESLYFISRTALGEHSYLKSRLYYDRFTNALYAFDDNTYSTQKKPSSFQSFYLDDTYGGSLEYGLTPNTSHDLKTSFHYKQDHHRENNRGEPVRTFTDHTLSVGLEDTYRMTERLSLVPGVSFNARKSEQAQGYDAKTGTIGDFAGNRGNAWNGQVGAFYTLSPRQKVSVTVARKSRFPTIKDRYSYRMGAAIPNPDLKAETATHYEGSYTGRWMKGFQLRVNVFYSRLSEVIQQVNNVQPNIFQLQNAGNAEFYGSELAVEYPLGKSGQAGVNYTYLHRQNRTNPDLKFTDVPDHKVFAYGQYQWRNRAGQPLASLLASFEYNSVRYSTSYGTQASDFGLVNLKASVRLHAYVSLEGGVNNLLDKNYALAEGFPEEGRNYFVTLILRTP